MTILLLFCWPTPVAQDEERLLEGRNLTPRGLRPKLSVSPQLKSLCTIEERVKASSKLISIGIKASLLLTCVLSMFKL
jgi:hypothetical protein